MDPPQTLPSLIRLGRRNGRKHLNAFFKQITPETVLSESCLCPRLFVPKELLTHMLPAFNLNIGVVMWVEIMTQLAYIFHKVSQFSSAIYIWTWRLPSLKGFYALPENSFCRRSDTLPSWGCLVFLRITTLVPFLYSSPTSPSPRSVSFWATSYLVGDKINVSCYWLTIWSM